MAIKYPKGRVRRYAVHRKFRNVVMSTRYKDAPYTVGCMLRSSPFKHPTVEHMCKILKREVHHLCGMKCGKSILRDLTPKRLSNFSWAIVCKEIKNYAPTLYQVVRSVTSKSQQKHLFGLGTSLSVILKHRNKFLGLLQGIVSVILYVGHCSKQVNSYCARV